MRNTVIGLTAAVAIITAGATVNSSACGYGGSHHGGSHYGGYGKETGGLPASSTNAPAVARRLTAGAPAARISAPCGTALDVSANGDDVPTSSPAARAGGRSSQDHPGVVKIAKTGRAPSALDQELGAVRSSGR
jgi:hypothetical protein